MEEAHPHCCDLEVDVNGEETFMVNKKIISVYSNKLSKLFGKGASKTRNLKLVFNDFPGGARSFELIARFCYSNGEVKITPFNVCLLYSAARYMEMDKSGAGTRNLLEQAEKFVGEINCWSWSELMAAIKQCQDTLMNDRPFAILVEKIVESLVGRLLLASEASPSASTSSPDGAGFRFSCDSKSTESLKNSVTRVTWWFEDLVSMEPSLVQMVVRTMIAHKLDHALISKFLFFYQKTKFFTTATSGEKRKLMKTLIDMLFLLDSSVVSSRSLFAILRICISLNVDKSSRTTLESMIGSQMDKATLDNLLIPASAGTNCLYDVNLILRLLKAFLFRGYSLPSSAQIKRVASLIDVYITEIAPDPSLKPSKYIALVTALPDSARESHDALYHAIDLYLQVHASFSEEEKLKLCSVIKYEKLSPEAFSHLTQNNRFALNSGIQASKSCKSKLEKLTSQGIKTCPEVDPSCNAHIAFHDGELDVHKDSESLREHIKGMQCRVMELEKACKKMQNQMTTIMKSRSTSRSVRLRSLPKLCS